MGQVKGGGGGGGQRLVTRAITGGRGRHLSREGEYTA